ncbi:MAG: hypothetical protein O2913_04210 [Chloroflexi bacterium]|nr:hypothetical protein [Chloroflexota bacterium]
MRLEHRSGYDWMNRIGLMIVAPVVVMAAAAAVMVLSTPITMALTVIAFATAILYLGTLLTREEPVVDKAMKAMKEDSMCESTDLIATLEPETIAMVDDLTDAPKTAVSASITKVYGGCPLNLMPGNTWEIGPDGKLSRPMCRSGATALSALFQMANGDVMDRSVCCECEFAGREVTFTVREPGREPVGEPA